MVSKLKIIAVFDIDGNFLSCCSRKRAKKVIKNKKGYYVEDRVLVLKKSKTKQAKERHEVIEESKRVCYICSKKIPNKETATVDHVIPKSRDEFADNKFNMKCCCGRCNTDKSNKTLYEYIQYIRRHREQYTYLFDKRLDYLEEYAKRFEKEYFGFYVKYADRFRR